MSESGSPAGATRSRAVWIVLLSALAVRALVPLLSAAIVGEPRVFHAPDSAGYMDLAQELAAHGRFERSGAPEVIRTPGYPLLLVPGALTGFMEGVAIALQVMLGGLTTWLVYRISLHLFEHPTSALVSAYLYAFEPLSVVYASKVLTETLFTCLIVGFLHGLLRYLKTTRSAHLIGAAGALVGSVYVRPISYFLPMLVAAGLLLRALRRGPERNRRLAHGALFFALSLTLVGLWQVRNAVQAGYSGFSAISDVNLYYYQGASVLAAVREVPFAKVQEELGYPDDEVYRNAHPELRDRPRGETYRAMGREGLRTLAQHPFTYAKVHVKGMVRTLADPGAIEYLKLFRLYPASGGLLGVAVDQGLLGAVAHLLREQPIAFWSTLALGLVVAAGMGLALASVIRRPVRSNPLALALLLVGAYFLLMCGGPQAEGRFRHPLMPVVCIFAGERLAALIAKWRGRGGG